MSNDRQVKQEREEFSALDAAGLNARLNDEKKKLWADRFALGKRQLTNTSELGKSRKRIARIQTYLRQLELKQQETSK